MTAVRGEPPLLRKAKPNGGGAAKCGVGKIQRIFLKANDDSAKPQDGGAAKGSADRIQRAFLKAREILQKKRMASRQKVSAESNEAGRDEVEVLQGQAPCFAVRYVLEMFRARCWRLADLRDRLLKTLARGFMLL